MKVKRNLKTTSLSVAIYFLKASHEKGESITNLKLQKLIYYAQVWHLVLFGDKLFNKPIEAWVHGPAIPSVYRHFKSFEYNPIPWDDDYSERLNFSNKQEEFLENVFDVYGKYDAGYLEALTHSELPWQKAREGLSCATPSNNEIDLEIAREYYAGKLKSSHK